MSARSAGRWTAGGVLFLVGVAAVTADEKALPGVGPAGEYVQSLSEPARVCR